MLCPADSAEVGPALEAALGLPGPAYIRLGKKGEPAVHEKPPVFVVGKGIVMREGTDICLFGMGTLVSVALAAAKELEAQGLSARVVSMHTVKPLDEALLADAFGRFRAVAVVEEHSVIGGLGSAVAEWLARRDGPHPPLVACGTPDAFISEAGSQQWMRERCGLTGPAVAASVVARLGASR